MSRKSILIDGYNLALESGTGVATYARNLTHCAHELDYEVHVLYGTRAAPKHPLLAEIAFFDARGARHPFAQWIESAQEWFGSNFGVRAKTVPITGKVITRQFQSRLPYYDQLWNSPNLWARASSHNRFFFNRRLPVRMPKQPDLVHWTYPLPLHVPRARNLYTLHDLVPLRLPYTTLDVKRHYFGLVQSLVRKADHIVTVSENSKRDIVNLLGVAEDRVTNTYQAVDIPAKYMNKPEEVVRREVEGSFNLTYKGYFLFYGAIEPKKNVGRLIEAYLSSKVDTPLVILGKLAWKSDEEMRLLNEDVVRYLERIDNITVTRRRIMHIDYAPFPLLVSLIRGAKSVLFPSLYEGFGLPVLESMLLGTPVLTSTESSLPEVAGDAAVLVDPYSTMEMAEGIRALDSGEQLRGELSSKGRRQAALYSMANYQKRLAELYNRVA